MSTTTKPVLIIGAGISGLALAQGLLKAGIPFRVFERDARLNIRSQGYRFRLIDTGIDALARVLPPDLFERVVATCGITTSGKMGAGARLDALSSQPMPGPGGPQPHGNVEPLNVDRTVLRSQLIRGLEEYVEYGKEFSSYEIMPSGVTVKFGDGSEAEGSLLVGADGARSRIRRQFVPQHGLIDTEGRLIYGKTVLTPELTERMEKQSLSGLTLIQDPTHDAPLSLLLEPIRFKDNEIRGELPEDYIYWALIARKDILNQDDAGDAAMLKSSDEDAATLAQTLTSHWHSSFHALFDLQDRAQTSILRVASAQPNIPVWEPSGRVTLIGDAAHLMSPSAGVGATSALRDAANLMELLKDEGIKAESVGKYEGMMREYAGEAITRSSWGGKMLFGMRPFDELKTVVI
ncbi:hypothetical protein MMC28_006028 [Mycoblastus sanguinarius]|nr:hypothetical protein [Mycoblastus sanguinarius]